LDVFEIAFLGESLYFEIQTLKDLVVVENPSPHDYVFIVHFRPCCELLLQIMN